MTTSNAHGLGEKIPLVLGIRPSLLLQPMPQVNLARLHLRDLIAYLADTMASRKTASKNRDGRGDANSALIGEGLNTHPRFRTFRISSG